MLPDRHHRPRPVKHLARGRDVLQVVRDKLIYCDRSDQEEAVLLLGISREELRMGSTRRETSAEGAIIKA
ncbi:hypothetical protein ACFLYR_08445 [Chloroflexota bacterium]